MNINFRYDTKYVFYETEIEKALNWLYKIRDDEMHGWAWVQFIRPNEQNTAEVICAYAENEQWLEDNPEKIHELKESIEYWLLDTSHAKISIDYCWVLHTLQKIRTCEILYRVINHEHLEKAVGECLQWLLNNHFDDKAKGHGWGDNNLEISNIIRTSLAVVCFNEEIAHLEKRSGNTKTKVKEKEMIEKRLQQYRALVAKTVKWLIATQNKDGGWGNLDDELINQDYQSTHSFSYNDLKYQCDSNAASTGYVMLALKSCGPNQYEAELKKAYDYLKLTQMDNGGWSVFTEVGIRDNERYTFRHFGTTWALQGILKSDMGDYRDECVIHGFEYLAELQDENYGGWKSSPDADNYTWATCNALSTINLIKEDLSEVHAKHFLYIIWDWWSLKKKDTDYSFQLGKTTFAFNGAMALAFCLTFSLMITLMLAFTFREIDPFMLEKSETVRKFIYSVITVLDAIILGLPWIVYVKNRFRQEVDGWIDSIGWVYGIITGFVLVLYQFII